MPKWAEDRTGNNYSQLTFSFHYIPLPLPSDNHLLIHLLLRLLLSLGSLILLSVMLRAAMCPSLSIPSYYGRRAKRSYREEMTTEAELES
uniref:Uncharacterized protein n=1 Tax=Rhizophora mucronata TaxID=61149 RepID=A0A2P2LIG1_RHIMU